MTTILKITVENISGILDRIAGVFRHYGWNIDNISAAEVKPGITDIKIFYKSRFVDEKRLYNKISKMDYVKKYEVCTEQSHLFMEMAIIKIKEANISEELNKKGRILLKKGDVCIMEYTASPSDVQSLLSSIECIDCDRSGGVGIGIMED